MLHGSTKDLEETRGRFGRFGRFEEGGGSGRIRAPSSRDGFFVVLTVLSQHAIGKIASIGEI
jgi:hypothetical protein